MRDLSGGATLFANQPEDREERIEALTKRVRRALRKEHPVVVTMVLAQAHAEILAGWAEDARERDRLFQYHKDLLVPGFSSLYRRQMDEP